MKATAAELLAVLVAHDVDFIVVGMTAGILQGVPSITLDLDVVHKRTPENIERLLRALAELDALYRHDPRQLRPKESHLASPGPQLLTTKYGDLDCLGTIGEGRSYEDLASETVEMQIATGGRIRVLKLRALIESKEQSGRPKDLAVLPLLRGTLDEIERRQK
jgi:hypothetical protein